MKNEALSGIFLLVALVIVVFVANSPLNAVYQAALHFSLFSHAMLFWVNDLLMAFFFLLLALEIKREMVVGELRRPAQVILPVAAACGGIILPALIYIMFVHQDGDALRGWAIPVATDVALALGLLALLGKRVPVGLKIFLTVLAIADDLIAIIIIAAFYTEHLSYVYLSLALLCIAILIMLNLFGITRLGAYFAIGILLWLAVLKSGVHPTLAGVVLGFCIPFHNKKLSTSSPLKLLEKRLKPWVNFIILPLFILANAGVPILQYQMNDLLQAVPLGIALGLFLGKQIGILLVSWLIIKMGFARLPAESNWLQLYGIAILAGIGFTMSIFISNLAFPGTGLEMLSRVGILVGSLCSAILGLLILYYSKRKN